MSRVIGVRFAEVEFDPPMRDGMIVEMEGGLRLLVSDDQSVTLAAEFINCLWRLQAGGGR